MRNRELKPCWWAQILCLYLSFFMDKVLHKNDKYGQTLGSRHKKAVICKLSPFAFLKIFMLPNLEPYPICIRHIDVSHDIVKILKIFTQKLVHSVSMFTLI